MAANMMLKRESAAGLALVVDDDPASIHMVTTALEENGTTVLVARDGASAIELAQRIQPDVILMDAVMPHMDGFETCRRLKAAPVLSTAPIVFMTGLTAPEHLLRGLEAGGVDYVTKPVVLDELLARITIHVINARRISSARAALDQNGGALAAFLANGQFSWASPMAAKLLEQSPLRSMAKGGEVDPSFLVWLHGLSKLAVSQAPPYSLDGLHLSFLGMSPDGERLVSVGTHTALNSLQRLEDIFKLTEREAEVLIWLTQGKTNRDIGEILGLSPRTVNKHLEQVFQKMGVDNRTSAALIADREIGRA